MISHDKRTWDEEDDTELDSNTKRTRTELLGESGSTK